MSDNSTPDVFQKPVAKDEGSNTWHDPETGEVERGRWMLVGFKGKNEFKDFWMANMLAFEEHAELRLPARTLWVRDLLYGLLEFENWIKVDRQAIAKRLKLRPENVSREITKLTKMGFLLKGNRSCGSFSYKLNPDIGWRGKAVEHKTAISQRDAKLEQLGATLIEGGLS